MPAWQAAVPVVTIVGYVLVSAFRGGSSIAFLIPMALAVFISTGIAVYNAIRAWQIRLEKQKAYDLRLQRMRREMKAAHDQQRAFYNYNYPDAEFIMKMDGKRFDNRGGSRLWERRTDDLDFAHVRLGIGVRPSTVVYKVNEQGDNDENPQMQDAERLEADSRFVDQVPLTLPLYQNPFLAEQQESAEIAGEDDVPSPTADLTARSTIGIAGAGREDVYPFVYSIVTSLAGLHAPTDLEIYVLGTRNVAENWLWAYEMPHCTISAKDGQSRIYFEDIERIQSPVDAQVIDMKVKAKAVIRPGQVVAVIRTMDTREVIEIQSRHYGKVEWVLDISEDRFVKAGQMMARTADFALNRQQSDEERDHNKPLQYQMGKHREERQTAGVPRYWKEKIWKQLDRRERLIREKEEGEAGSVSLPLMVLFVDMMESRPDEDNDPLKQSWLSDMESEAAMSLIMSRAAQLGIAVFFLVPARQRIPSGCRSVIELTRDANNELRFLYAETGLNSQRYVGQADAILRNRRKMGELQNFVYNLSQAEVRRSYGADIPRAVGLLDLFRAEILGHSIEENGLKVRERWEQSRTPDRAEWPKMPLGMMAGSEPRELHFFADADGVHGMIAGSTGSGKSELLMTMILSLAAKYDPTVVNFVLIDYKGGAAFEPFKTLPHVVDIVTNLRGNAVERMFKAINAELNRRQDINQRTDSKDIVRYRLKGFHETRKDNYPHLFIIIDEFAEMIASNPEYRAQLDSITRLGRALGVSLILAAQRPTGVTDQMRANIKFRICLRVETKEESQELLRRPDASFLPSIPGRGYLQVGSESLELIQVGYTGMNYDDPSDYDPDERFVDMEIIWADAADNADVKEPLFEVMVRRMKVLTDEKYPEKDQRTWRKPWPDPLPEFISLDSREGIEIDYLNPDDEDFVSARLENLTPKDTRFVLCPEMVGWKTNTLTDWPGTEWNMYAMTALVGLVDDPINAQLRLMQVNFKDNGHYGIFGAAGTGKTTLLRTIVSNLVSSHSPHELNLYMLDFSSNLGLLVFKDLPHTGAHIQPHETERIERLLRMIDQEIDDRKRILSNYGELYNFNDSKPPQAQLPAILVVFDNFASFRDDYEHLMDEVLMSLVREGATVGVHFLFASDQMKDVGRISSLLLGRIALRQSDEAEYTGIVGAKGVKTLEELEGRVVVKVEREALVGQAAMPVEPSGLPEATESDDLKDYLTLLRDAGKNNRYIKPPEILELEEWCYIDDLYADYQHGQQRRTTAEQQAVTPLDEDAITFPIGRNDFDLAPMVVSLSDRPHFIVTGGPSAGKTTMLQTWILWLAEHYSPSQVGMVMLDYQRQLPSYGSDHRSLESLPHMMMPLIDTKEQFKQFVDNLYYEWQHKKQRAEQFEIFVFMDSFSEGDLEALSDRDETLIENLSQIARFGKEVGIHFVLGIMESDLRNLSMNQFFTNVKNHRYGFAFDVEIARGNPFHARVPKRFNNVPPMKGRGFVTDPGGVQLVQASISYQDEKTRTDDIDSRVGRVLTRYQDGMHFLREIEGVGTETSVNGNAPDDRSNGLEGVPSTHNLQGDEQMTELTQQQRDCILLQLAEPMGISATSDEDIISIVEASFTDDDQLISTAQALGVDIDACLGG